MAECPLNTFHRFHPRASAEANSVLRRRMSSVTKESLHVVQQDETKGNRLTEEEKAEIGNVRKI